MASLREAGDLPGARDPRVFAELIGLLGLPQALDTARRYEES